MNSIKILSLDFGEKRIGLAVGDTESKIVSFFTKFFVDDAEVSVDKESLNNLTIQKIESKADKNKEKNLSQ